MLHLLYLPVLTLFILLYFQIAVKHKIIDKPNQRSSHTRITVRGAGIIFPAALLIHYLISGFNFTMFILGLVLISTVSFYDDLKPLSNKIRIIVHLIAVTLIFMQTDLLSYPVWIIFLSYILVIGTINAYNFMDGINGITGVYSLITILSLYYINEFQFSFVNTDWLIVSAMALLAFNFFNFRKTAKCFAGDVGSVSMAFIIIFFLLTLIIQSGDLKYIGLLLVYGLDTVITIIFRLIRRENIFEAHRSHFYQYLANSRSWPHLLVSTCYALVQLLINVLLLNYALTTFDFLCLVILSGIVVVLMRVMVEGKQQLFNRT